MIMFKVKVSDELKEQFKDIVEKEFNTYVEAYDAVIAKWGKKILPMELSIVEVKRK